MVFGFVLSTFGNITGQNMGDDIVIGKYDKIFSKVLNEERTLLVRVPQGFEHSKVKYPVLYVLDGYLSSFIATVGDVARIEYEISPLIVVAITNTNRNRDMIPDNEAQNFLKFLTSELFPYIENKYRADHYRILYGGSNAGLFVLYSLFENPDSFSAYIASSPTIGWSYETLVNKTEIFSALHTPPSKFLYIISGGKDDQDQVITKFPQYIQMLEGLKEKGLNLNITLLPDEGHVPFMSLQSGLLSLFEGYSYPDEMRQKGGLEALISYYKKFSEKFGYEVKYPFSAIQGVGQRLLFREKNIKEAIAVLELGLHQQPGLWVNNIMLALAYYKDNQMDLAKEYYLKAKEIDPLSEPPPFPEFKEMEEKFLRRVCVVVSGSNLEKKYFKEALGL
jgi:predicted alpha/beta superfamily hydrolase